MDLGKTYGKTNKKIFRFFKTLIKFLSLALFLHFFTLLFFVISLLGEELRNENGQKKKCIKKSLETTVLMFLLQFGNTV